MILIPMDNPWASLLDSLMEILPFEHQAAFHYGEIRTYLERKGIMIGGMDLLIASHAMSLSSALVTNNVREFKSIPNLHLENWT